MFKWIKQLFQIPESISIELPLITLETVGVFDTVWIKEDDIIRQGWIFEKSKKRIVVVADDKEYIFHYQRPYNKTELTCNNKILYLNKPL